MNDKVCISTCFAYKKIKKIHSIRAKIKKKCIHLYINKRIKADLRILIVLELPWLGERRQGSEIEGPVLTDQLALHLPRETDSVGAPLERGRTTCRLWQQLRGAEADRVVAGEQDGGLTLGRDWSREEMDWMLDSRLAFIVYYYLFWPVDLKPSLMSFQF